MTAVYTISQADESFAYTLSELRVASMRESLEAVGRFDPLRARSRFLDSFRPELTSCISLENEIAGFYVLLESDDLFWLDHFYIHPDNQSQGLGGQIIRKLIEQAHSGKKPLDLKALKGSRSNQFYLKNGFVKQREDEWDIIYRAPIKTTVV